MELFRLAGLSAENLKRSGDKLVLLDAPPRPQGRLWSLEAASRNLHSTVNESRLLRLDAASRNMRGLVDVLEQLRGLHLADRYCLDSLHRIGSQFAVFRGRDLEQGRVVAVKIPLLDYTRPASFGAREIQFRRHAILQEWDILQQYAATTTVLPVGYALIRGSNPLLAGRSQHSDETFLVEEWIDGDTLDEVRRSLFASPEPSLAQLNRVVEDVAHELLIAVASLAPNVYSDVAPRNFLRCARTGRVRIVDAGSVVPDGTRSFLIS